MHISYPRLANTYKHHAIVVTVDTSKGTYEVIHFSGRLKEFLSGDISKLTQKTARVKRDEIDFDTKDKIRCYDYNLQGYDLKYLDISPEAIIERAEKIWKNAQATSSVMICGQITVNILQQLVSSSWNIANKTVKMVNRLT